MIACKHLKRALIDEKTILILSEYSNKIRMVSAEIIKTRLSILTCL